MVVGSQQLLQQLDHVPSINLIGKTLQPVSQVKDLGTILDSKLKYNEHIQYLSSSCISKLCQINKVKYRTATGQRTFKYRGIKIWNALDEELKSIVDINNFKSKQDALWSVNSLGLYNFVTIFAHNFVTATEKLKNRTIYRNEDASSGVHTGLGWPRSFPGSFLERCEAVGFVDLFL